MSFDPETTAKIGSQAMGLILLACLALAQDVDSCSKKVHRLSQFS